MEVGEQNTLGRDILVYPPEGGVVVMQLTNRRLIFTSQSRVRGWRLREVAQKLAVNEDVLCQVMGCIQEHLVLHGINIGWDEWIEAERRMLAA